MKEYFKPQIVLNSYAINEKISNNGIEGWCDLESGIQTVDLINCIANRIKEYNKN